jgi:crossover junction endodeoxyribonuclease RusA
VNQTEIFPPAEIVKASLALTLPWPPSVNSYWQPFPIPGGRVVMSLTKRARLYRTDVHAAIRKIMGPARSTSFETPVRVDIELRAPDRRSRDIDNHLKGIFDALTHAGIWKDDSLVDELTLHRGKVLKDGAAIVIITEL